MPSRQHFYSTVTRTIIMRGAQVETKWWPEAARGAEMSLSEWVNEWNWEWIISGEMEESEGKRLQRGEDKTARKNIKNWKEKGETTANKEC